MLKVEKSVFICAIYAKAITTIILYSNGFSTIKTDNDSLFFEYFSVMFVFKKWLCLFNNFFIHKICFIKIKSCWYI